MNSQSSFLIRCWVNPEQDPAVVKGYQIQHIQSGAEFRSADLAAITEWMAAVNTRYAAAMLHNPQVEKEESL